MGFMPNNFPCESELKSMTAQQKVDIEQQFIEYYKRYAFMSTQIVHNDMCVKVSMVNEEVRNLVNQFWNLHVCELQGILFVINVILHNFCF